MGIAEVKREIRRAVYMPLDQACKSSDLKPLIEWTGKTINRQETKYYVTPTIIWGSVDILEVGPTPRFRGNGSLYAVIRSPLKLLEDANDRLSAVVACAYPYPSQSTFGGLTVNIDKSTPGPYVVDGTWLTSHLTIDWNVYRRS